MCILLQFLYMNACVDRVINETEWNEKVNIKMATSRLHCEREFANVRQSRPQNAGSLFIAMNRFL